MHEKKHMGSAYSNDNLIGQGHYGEVRKIDQDMVKKILKMKEHNGLTPACLREIVLVDYIHRNFPDLDMPIIKYKSVSVDNHINLIMKRYTGDLMHLLETDRVLDLEEVRRIVFKIIEGMYIATELGIGHRDLKPENILIDLNGEKLSDIVIADWGMSRFLNSTESDFYSNHVQTPCYCAPERLTDDPLINYSGAIDVWSLGVIIYCLLKREFPFDGNKKRFRQNIQSIHKQRLSYFDFEPDLKNLMTHIWEINPENRWTFSQLYQHSWFSKYHHIPSVLIPSKGRLKDPEKRQELEAQL